MAGRLVALLLLVAAGSPLNAQWLDLETPGIPRTEDGKVDADAPAPRLGNRPDLSGLWIPVEQSGSLYDAGKILPWAREVMTKNEGNFFMDDPRFNCLPSGPGAYPAGRSSGGLRRIVQHPEFIAVLDYELNYRQIYLDGRELEEEPIIPTWQGYSVGRWEGQTLVVESNGYNDKTWLTREGLPHTDQLKVTERYSRPSFGRIDLKISYSDPGTFTEPVEATMQLQYMADTQLLETVCNESETSGRHYDGDIAQAEQKTVQIPEETLASYTGTYQGIWLGGLITTEFVLEDGDFYLVRTPAYTNSGSNEASKRYELYAQSENAFDCTCGLGFVFHENDDGVVDVVDEVHVSGAWPFKRVD